jgi:prevent-host-death family protein
MDMRKWQIQTAKARLSEVLRASEESGPQEITLRGNAVAVVVAKADFDRLTSRKGAFVEFMRRSPLAGMELKIRRDKSPARRVEL